MYSRAKYVVGKIRSDYSEQLVAVIIPETINHKDIKSVFIPGSIRSAGFCSCGASDKVHVYGKSTSLNVECNPVLDELLVGRAMAHPIYET
jgi:hypothetical protein